MLSVKSNYVTEKRIGLMCNSKIKCSVCCVSISCALHAMVNFKVFIDLLEDSPEMTAVSVCGKVSGYRKGYFILREANVLIVLPNRGSHLMSYCQE